MRTCVWCLELSVLFLVSLSFYFLSLFLFQLYLMSTSAPDERFVSNPLCNSSLGSVVTSDYVTPLTLRAPPVPPGRDMQASEDLFMDLDEPSLKRPRDTPSSSTQQSDFANPDEFVQRARNVSVPLPKTPEQPVPAPETPFQPVPHGNVAPETPQFIGSFNATISMLSWRRDCAPDAACGKLEDCSTCAIILSSCLTADAQHVCSSIHADPVVAHDHVPTQFDEEFAVDTQSDDPFSV